MCLALPYNGFVAAIVEPCRYVEIGKIWASINLADTKSQILSIYDPV